MWIAKNSVTGKTYGEKYSSIYECQAFIDKELCLLEYEMQRCFSLEKEVIYDFSHRGSSLFDIIRDGLEQFRKDSGVDEQIKIITELSYEGKTNKEIQSEIDEKLQHLANTRWQKNNIIRCWYVEQKRYADGFDF